MKVRLLFIWLLLMAAQTNATTLIDSVKAITSSSVGKYEKFEVGIASSQLRPENFINPYDSSDVNMYAIFTAPSGKKFRRNAFWYKEYDRCNSCPNWIYYTTWDSCNGWRDTMEYMSPTDPDAYLKEVNTPYPWRVRFAPIETGTWSYKVYTYSVFGIDSSSSNTFTSSSSSDKGYIRADSNLMIFRYKDSGDPFIPIGINSVKGGKDSGDYNRAAMLMCTTMMDRMVPFGGNFLRIWMNPSDFCLEWASPDGIGNYDARQPRAFDLDSVVTFAEKKNVYLQLLLTVQDEFNFERQWVHNPYNSANTAGLADTPRQFFYNANCRKFYQRKMRYIIARWGYSPHLLAYEPMQEMNLFTGAFWDVNNEVKDWVSTMIRYGKSQDTNHLYTISLGHAGDGKFDKTGNSIDANGIFNLPELDYIDVHNYSSSYNIAFERNYIQRFCAAKFPKKPMMMGEMGWGSPRIDWAQVDCHYQLSVFFDNDWHNSLWSTLFGGQAGPGVFYGNPGNVLRMCVTGTDCWGGEYEGFKAVSMFLDSERIFLRHPVPIANTCTGRGPKDPLWRNFTEPLFALDTTTNKCSCYPRYSTRDTFINNAFVTTGVTTTNDTLIEVFGLKVDNRVIGWIHNKENYWYLLPHHGDGNLADSVFIFDNKLTVNVNDIAVLTNDSVTIAGLSPGSYRLDFYSTYPRWDINPAHFGTEYGGIIPAFTDTVDVSCTGTVKFRIPTLRPLYYSSAPYQPDYGFKLGWIGIDPPRELTASATWNTSTTIPRSVIIPNNLTLTISHCTIRIPADSFIRVMPGGKLIIDSATLTSGCDSSFWYGIQVSGQTGLAQNSTNQGMVIIENGSIIENAWIGVRNWGDSTGNKNGGIIQASNSTFLNNRKAVDFWAFHNHVGASFFPDNSSFTKCTFEVNDYYIGGNYYPFDCGAALFDVVGIRFYACNFYNKNTHYSEGKGQGIRAYNAGFMVLPACSNGSFPCNATVVRSKFEGFQEAIRAEGDIFSWLAYITVDKANFDKNSIGVRSINVENISVTRDTFRVGNGEPIEITECNENVGIYTTGTTQFRIEENTLIGTPAIDWANFGIITEDCPATNEVYKNRLTDLNFACIAIGNNSSPLPIAPLEWPGLKYACNYFEDNVKDISVSVPDPTSNNLPLMGIAGFQGTGPTTTTVSAGNVFASGSGSQNVVNTGHPFAYYYGGTNTEPLNVVYDPSVTSVNIYLAASNNSCASRLSDGGPVLGSTAKATYKSIFYTLKAEADDAVQDYMQLIDAGSTSGLIAYIAGRGARDSVVVEDTLLAISPFVSEAVLRYTTNKGILPISRMMNVLLANPDVLRNSLFLNYLQEFGHPQITDPQRSTLVTASANTTTRTSDRFKLLTVIGDVQDAFNYLVTDFKNDSLYTEIDSIPAWYHHLNKLKSTYALAGYYYSRDSLTLAAAELADIPSNFILSHEDSLEYETYQAAWDVYSNMKTEGRTVFDLIEDELEGLQINHDELQGKQIEYGISNITGIITGIHPVPCLGVNEPDLPDSRPAITPGTNVGVDSRNSIKVYPNPAKDKVTFDYRIPGAKGAVVLTITNIAGGKVAEILIEGREGKIEWNTMPLSAGNYLYRFSDGTHNLEVGKITLIR